MPQAELAQSQQSRYTQLAGQSALSFHPPSSPSSLSFLGPSFTLALPPSTRSRVSVPVASKFEQNYLLLYLFGPKAHDRTTGADSESVPLAA